MALTLTGDGDITGLAVGALPADVIGAGAVLQVQSTYLTSATQLTSAGALHELSTSLRLSITPKSASSILYLQFYSSFVSPQSNALQYAAFYDVTASAYVNLPPANGSRQRVHWFKRTTLVDINDADSMNFSISVASSSTASRTYTIYHGNEGQTNQFLSSTLSTTSGATYPILFKITEIAQ